MNKTNANEKKELKTRKGYDFFIISSAMQKAIRRGDARVAGFCALELYHSGYHKYVWKRLLTISAEDCYGVITKEIWALYQSFNLVNEGKKDFSKEEFEALKNRQLGLFDNLVYGVK